ncbi:hypothetical protein Syun_020376 [Stephania yunnanensis]|uniref:Uncharacterized protein n=1 Tax=Stephania yunnanensis TaxID=152371 RepID=A0AAP0IDN9_9MAGN
MGGVGGERSESMSIFRLFSFADRKDKLLMVLGSLGSIGDGFMTPLTMLVLSDLINTYGTNSSATSTSEVNKHALRLLYVAVLVGSSAFVEGICWTRTAERQTSRIRRVYLKSVLRQDIGFLDVQTDGSMTSQVISAISNAHIIQDVLGEKIPNCLAQLSSFIFSLAVAFILSWRLTFAALPFSLGFIIPGLAFGKALKDLERQKRDAYGVAGGILEQALSSIRTVFSYVGEHQTQEKFSQALQISTELGVKQGLVKGLLIGSMGMMYATWAFQSWVGSILVTERGDKGGPVFIAEVCVILGGLSVLSALPNITFFAEATSTASKIFKMIDQIPIIDAEDEKGKVPKHVRGEIVFKRVTFNYPSRPDAMVLDELNLQVPTGSTVGLVGGSGSGKSTVIALLQRFYDPVKGDIFLDGNKISKLQLKWLRSQMGLVNQQPILFATSIKENILFGKEGASMDLVMSAAKAANAHDFITQLPKGYETPVGQFGVQLSGGQKQRIAIARALVRDPKILLLDEATSALDAESERIVQETLDQASVGRTTIIIAHRLSTICRANTIAVLQSGNVIESGTHDQLIRHKGGVYYNMVQLQQKALHDKNLNSHLPDTNRSIHHHGTTSPINLRSNKSSTHAITFSPTAEFLSPTHSFIQSHTHEESDEVERKLSSQSAPSQQRLLQMNAPEWKKALVGCIGAVGFGVVQTASVFCLGSVVSIYFLKDHALVRSETKFYCFIFLMLAFLTLITNLLQHYNFAVMGEKLTKRVREKMLEKVMTFEVGWFDEDENTGAAICARFATEANMVRSLVGDRISLLVQVFAAASLAFVLGLVISWRLGSVMIATQPLVIVCFYSRSVLMKKMSEKARKAQNEGSKLASEAIVNHRTITAFSSQKKILGLFADTLKSPRKETIKQSWFAAIGLSSSQFVITASIALAYWYGGKLMNEGLITPKRLFQAFFVLMSTGKHIADAGSMTSDLARGADAIKSVFAILDRKSEINPNNLEGIRNRKAVKGDIELKNVVFSYPARPEQMIFRNLNLKIEAGKTIALVGPSGSGKSTVIGLIERFYDPTKGSVEIDRQDIKQYNLRALRSQIALVSQEPTLLQEPFKRIFPTAMITQQNSMKDGYQTYCGERGTQLSGGQKQRIALARAILKNPAILLLDEATSALDSVSENLVQEALEKMMVSRTCVVIAHRLSTIQKSDTIAVIQNGKVVEQGSHYNLLAIGQRGAYYSLVKLQGP